MRELLCPYIGLFLIIFGFANHPILAQNNSDYNLVGQVMDLDDGKELEGTFVILKENNETKITNQHGKFNFEHLHQGPYTLIVRHIGCRDTLIVVDVKKNTKLIIKLPHSALELQNVDVIDKQTDMLKTQTTDALESKDLDRTRGQSLGEALKSINGVTTLNTGGTISKPMIHGMQGYRVLILNNGIRQEGQQWGNEHAPEIDPFVAQKLSVIKGANAVRYGSDAMAGVILVEPNDLPDTASVTGELNLIGITNGQTGVASGILQGNFDKIKGLSWRIQGTYKKGGTIKTPNYFLKNTGLQEMNGSYALAYHREKWGIEGYYSQFNSKIGIFSGAHIGNLTDLQLAFKASKPQDSLATFSYDIGRPYQDISHELIKTKFHFHIAPRWVAKLQYAYQYNMRKEFDKHKPLNNVLAALNKPELDYRITSQTIDVLIEHLNIKLFRGQFGGSYMNQKNVYLGRFFIPNYINHTWGVFATERYVKQHVELEAGIRYDQKSLSSFYYIGKDLMNPELQFQNFSWNTGAIFKPTKQFNMFINIGSAWRAPAPNELYSNGVHHGVGSIERGDANLKVEQVYNITSTALYQSKKNFIEITAYHNQFSNFIYMNPAPQPELTIRGAYPVFNYSQANARISGLDTKLQTQFFNHIELTYKAMLLRAWNEDIQDYLIYMPSDRYSVDAKIFTTLSKKLQDMYFQASYQFITKQWRVPTNTDFAPPPNEYGLVSAEIGMTIYAGKQPIQISLTGNNLMNTVYRDYLDRFRYFTDSQGRNFTFRLKMPLTIYDKK